MPTLVTLAVILLAVIALAGVHAWLGRTAGVTDRAVARLDADAGLGGELRSAYWFSAASDAADPWVAWHLTQAAGRLFAVEWAVVYPRVVARRAWLTAAGCAAAALLVVFVPGPLSSLRATAVGAGAAGAVAPDALVLPEDLRARLEALLGKVERGEISADAARASLEELRDLLARAETQPPTDASAASTDPAPAGRDLDRATAEALAQRAEAAADAADDMPQDVRFSLDDVAARLANAAREKESPDDVLSKSGVRATKGGGQAENASLAAARQAGLQLTQEAAKDPGSQALMMAGGGSMGGDSRAGAGGNSGQAGEPLAPWQRLAEALRRETIEASADASGANVTSEVKRRTEQGVSSVDFSGAAAAAYDPSRGSGPPAVPDALRALVRDYFIRK